MVSAAPLALKLSILELRKG